MLRYAAIGLLVLVQIYSVFEAAGTRSPRLMPRWAWVLVTLVVPVIGPALWFGGGRPPRRYRRPPAPDDDLGFLDSIR